MTSSKPLRFGYWPVCRTIEFSGGIIQPVQGLQDLVQEVNANTYSKNDLMYPPVHERHKSKDGQVWEVVPNSKHGAEMYKWIATHTLELRHAVAEPVNDFRKNPSFFILQCLAYIEGVRCMPEEWWYFGKLPLKNVSNAHFRDVPAALDVCLATWNALDEVDRVRLTNILQFYNSIVGFKWFWERFSHEYNVFDACWRFRYPRDIVNGQEVKSHRKRIRRMLGDLGITFEKDQIKEIVSMRNNLIHELSWAGETFVTEGDSSRLGYIYDLRRMNHRIIGQLLGMRGPYFRSMFRSHSLVFVEQVAESDESSNGPFESQINENGTELLRWILEQSESEWLDFKECYHDNKVELIHDILCLANSDAETNRYLVFGVDDARSVKGVSTDTKRKRQADLYDLISSWRLNVVPALRLFTVEYSPGVEVDILEIVNRSEKPYFIMEDKVDRGKTLRAGVVYSRLADRNTPINSCVDDKKLERMFLERFALHLTPNERFRRYLCDIDGWKIKESFNAFYKTHPEFTLKEKERDELQPYDEPWVKIFPDPDAYRYEVEARYFGTTIEDLLVISCDGSRYYCVQPKFGYSEDKDFSYWFYYHVRGSLHHDAYLFFRKGVTDFRGYKEPFAILESEAEVEECLSKARGGEYCDGMYLLKKDTRKFFRVAYDGKLVEIQGKRRPSNNL